jgi:hypothetical protein
MSIALILIVSVLITWFVTDTYRKGKELNQMVKAIGKIHVLTGELEEKIKDNFNTDEFVEELFVLAYIFRREVVFRQERDKWSMSSAFIVPGFSLKRTPLFEILRQTIHRLNANAKLMNCEAEVQDIMDGKALYFELGKSIPNYVKNLI